MRVQQLVAALGYHPAKEVPQALHGALDLGLAQRLGSAGVVVQQPILAGAGVTHGLGAVAAGGGQRVAIVHAGHVGAEVARQDLHGVAGIRAEHHLGVAEGIRPASQDFRLERSGKIRHHLPEVPGVRHHRHDASGVHLRDQAADGFDLAFLAAQAHDRVLGGRHRAANQFAVGVGAVDVFQIIDGGNRVSARE
ncbi:hypothetical protein D3C71_1558740 [compost metagenome]